MEAVADHWVGEACEASAVSRDVRGVQHDADIAEEVALERGDGSLDILEGRVARDEDTSEHEHGVASVDARQAVNARFIQEQMVHGAMVGGHRERAQSDNGGAAASYAAVSPAPSPRAPAGG